MAKIRRARSTRDNGSSNPLYVEERHVSCIPGVNGWSKRRFHHLLQPSRDVGLDWGSRPGHRNVDRAASESTDCQQKASAFKGEANGGNWASCIVCLIFQFAKS